MQSFSRTKTKMVAAMKPEMQTLGEGPNRLKLSKQTTVNPPNRSSRTRSQLRSVTNQFCSQLPPLLLPVAPL